MLQFFTNCSLRILKKKFEIPVIPQVSVPIYVGKIPKTVRNDELQEKFHTKDPVKRFGKGKFGFAKLFVPNDTVLQVLSQDSTLCGRKLRVAKWVVPVAPVATAAVSKSRDGHRHHSRKTSTTTCVSAGKSSVKEARFVADFLAAQARPGGDRQLYSRVLAPDKTAQRRMESMETAIKQILERLPKLRE